MLLFYLFFIVYNKSVPSSLNGSVGISSASVTTEARRIEVPYLFVIISPEYPKYLFGSVLPGTCEKSESAYPTANYLYLSSKRNCRPRYSFVSIPLQDSYHLNVYTINKLVIRTLLYSSHC